MIKIGVDSIFHPPYTFTEKRPRFSTNTVEENNFELLFDSTMDDLQLNQLLEGKQVKLNFKELEKDQEEEFEDDGVELEDWHSITILIFHEGCLYGRVYQLAMVDRLESWTSTCYAILWIASSNLVPDTGK